jgi:hypothetical protein
VNLLPADHAVLLGDLFGACTVLSYTYICTHLRKNELLDAWYKTFFYDVRRRHTLVVLMNITIQS